MNKKDIANIAASIRARLQNKATEANRPFAELLQYYGMERFLYRLSRSGYAGKFVLKGALMFTVWQVPDRRTTLDIDFLASCGNSVSSVEDIVRKVCSVTVVPDGLTFDAASVRGQKIKEDADYEGVRVKFLGLLERARIPMQLDVAFGDAVYPGPKMIEYPAILDLPRPHLKGYPVESMISEKFEAMITLGLLNSRMKDFYDIWLLMRTFDLSEARLAEAIRKTFIRRKTPLPAGRPLFSEEIYDESSDRQMLWNAFLNKSGIVHAPIKLSAVATEIEALLLKAIE